MSTSNDKQAFWRSLLEMIFWAKGLFMGKKK